MTLSRGIKYSAVLLVLGGFLLGPADVLGQRLFLNGGANLTSSTVQSRIAGTSPTVKGGVQFQYSDHLRLRGQATYQEVPSVGGLLQIQVRDQDKKLNPYLAAGYSYYLSNGGERGLLPVGLGIEYGLLENLDLNVELSGRFGVNQVTNGNRLFLNVMSSLMPSIGVSYQLEKVERQPPGPVPVESQDDQFTENAEAQYAQEQQFPFRDPAGGSPMATQDFNIPYTRDSLKQADPLIVRRGDAPYTGPGQPPITGEVIKSDDGTMVRLPDGTFIMGLTDEDPLDIQSAGRKRISLSTFYMDRFEVTNAEYREFLSSISGSNRQKRLPDSTVWNEANSQADWKTYFQGSSRSDYPVVGISWKDAQQYCQWDDKRLPTEAEWEYAARAGRVGGIYPWRGFSTQDEEGRYLANFSPGSRGSSADGYSFTAPVGAFPPNRWGVHDMAGNVAEWVQDAYTNSYSSLPKLNPVYRDSTEDRRVVRGGSWASNQFYIGVGVRKARSADEGSSRVGFRCAADVSQVEGTLEQVNDGAGRGRAQPSSSPQQGQQGGTSQSEEGSSGGGAQQQGEGEAQEQQEQTTENSQQEGGGGGER
jgi:formylglycine-generating enzyme required for sulfatase activity